MAVENRVRYAISVTPVEQLTDENAGIHDVIAGEVGKSLGGGGNSCVNDYTELGDDQGYTNAKAYYRRAPDGAAVDISANTVCSFLMIKNTGKKYSTTDTLGVDFDYSVKVMLGTTMISILAPGEVIVLKDENGGIVCTNIHVQTVTHAGGATSAGDLAVEFLCTTGI